MIKLIHQLLQWAPELKGKFFLAAVFKVIETMFMGAPYVFIFLTLNDILADSLSTKKVVFYTSGMAFCFLFQGIFSYLFSRTVWPTANYMVKKLRILIGEHLRKLSMGYFSEKTTGSLHTLVADEMLLIQTVIYRAFPDFIVAVTFAVLTPLFLLFIDWRLTLVTMAVIPAAAPFYLWQKNVLARGLRKRSDSLAVVNSEVIEYVQGMEVLKAFKQTGKQFVKFNDTLKKFRDLSIRVTMKAELPLTLAKAVLDLGLCLILLFATFFLLGGAITLTAFLIFLIMGLRIYEPIKLLIPSSGLLNMAEPAIHKIKDILDTKPLPQPENGRVPKAFDVQFWDVTFSYDKTPVLKNINFTVPEKTITALIGPSGSGKTTITRLIARFWDVDSGEVRVGGHDIRDMKIDDLLSQVSMVFQDVYLFNDTIYQNIAYGSKAATRENIIDAAKMAQCHDFITRLPHGYDTMVGEGGATLSGGEKQRISIARAILKDAPIILLDEATASVDPENEYLIQGAINSLVESKTLIIIAHRLSTITSADQIIVLNSEEKVEEMGKHEELLKRPGGLYSSLWKSRLQAKKWRIGEDGNCS
ncbi:MAG: ABC transporter ATP-binding protein/permease [Deltaproteobacteria bacterium]|nr:ABC transporter ATP-binding protein/permease [Deltaproteobacteria bacterium]MDL1962296.1 ABC transporter ATP-binding protein/permease [Deltaproteobacteria bacterium]